MSTPYEYKCPACKRVMQAYISAPPTCRQCNEPMQRVYGFNTTNMPTGGGRKMPSN